MKTVAAVEARARLGALLSEVARGSEVVITRRGKVVARLVPEPTKSPTQADVRRSLDGLQQLQQAIRDRREGRLSDREVRSAINEGRR